MLLLIKKAVKWKEGEITEENMIIKNIHVGNAESVT